MQNAISLSFDMILVMGIIVFTIVLSLWNVVRVDVVAVLVLVVLGITRLLPANQLFSGFSSEAVISLIAIMIIGAGLEKAGLTLKAARWVLKVGRERPRKISIVLMITSGLLSAFMRSLGTVAVLLPVVTRITSRTGIPKSRLLIPMGFCSIIGGTLTMVGSGPLILLNSLLGNAQEFVHQQISPTTSIAPFHLFSVFPIGFTLLVIGILYFHIFGKRLLPQESPSTFKSGTTKTHFCKTYGKGGDIFELKVSINSPIANGTLKDLELKLDHTSSILAVMQNKELHFPPLRNMIIEPNAIIAIMGFKETIAQLAEQHNLKLYPRLNTYTEILHPVRAGLAEAVIPPSSQLIGSELRELHMRRTYKLHVLALFRGQTVYQGEALKELVLRSGDTLGIFCQWEALADFHKNPDFVVLTTAYPREELRPNKIGFALLFFFLALALIVIGEFPVSIGLLLGAVGMIATGVLTIDEAYDTVSWRSVFLLAGLIPLGLAMQSTQTSDWITQHIPILQEHMPVWGIEAILALLSSLFSFAISPVGATIVLVPIAIDLAVNLNTDPRAFALIIALSASNSFLLPMQQVNALISGPGGYKTSDFFRAGLGLTLLYWMVVLIEVHFLFK